MPFTTYDLEKETRKMHERCHTSKKTCYTLIEIPAIFRWYDELIMSRRLLQTVLTEVPTTIIFGHDWITMSSTKSHRVIKCNSKRVIIQAQLNGNFTIGSKWSAAFRESENWQHFGLFIQQKNFCQCPAIKPSLIGCFWLPPKYGDWW